MKLSKKAVTFLSFTVGAAIFISTAFADMALGSGYDRLKDAVKNSASQMEKGLNNYTIETLITLKDNDQTLLQTSMFNKTDNDKKVSENSTMTQMSSGETTGHYSYADPKLSIWKNGTDNKYYVTEFPEDMNRGQMYQFNNPFNEKGAPEIEKIVDALVGNLKDYVQAEERPEGGRNYSGSLSEAQVPAVVNAVASYGLKQYISDQSRMERNSKLPDIESDVFVKKITGSAVETKAGLLENLTGTVILSGKDKNGAQHDLTLNVVLKLSDIGNTKITMPDLTGANVEKVSDSGGFSSKYVGKYKNNIIMEKDGKFVKIGERFLEITSVENNKVTGKYYETVKPGFEAEYPDKVNFNFEYEPKNRPMSFFTYTDAKGEQKNGELHPSNTGKVYLQLDIEVLDENSYRSNVNHEYFDGEFVRVFEE